MNQIKNLTNSLNDVESNLIEKLDFHSDQIENLYQKIDSLQTND